MPDFIQTREMVKSVLETEHRHSMLTERWSIGTQFDRPPATAVAVGTDLDTILAGTGVTTVARAAKGGVNLSLAILAANTNILAGVSTTAFRTPVSATNLYRVAGRFMIPSFANGFAWTFGLANTLHATIPSPASQGNGSCGFVFDPANALATGISAAILATNLICWVKTAASGLVFTDSGVPITAGKDFQLSIEVDKNLKPQFKSSGKVVGPVPSASAALTAAALAPYCGLIDNGAVTAKVFEVRWLKASGLIA